MQKKMRPTNLCLCEVQPLHVTPLVSETQRTTDLTCFHRQSQKTPFNFRQVQLCAFLNIAECCSRNNVEQQLQWCQHGDAWFSHTQESETRAASCQKQASQASRKVEDHQSAGASYILRLHWPGNFCSRNFVSSE